MNHTKVAVIGSLNMDIVVETPRHPRVGETLLGDRVRFVPGGKGANQAVAAARLGAEAAMIGAVGDDAFGLELLNALGRDGVDVTGVKRLSGTATGIASIYVGEGDNSIVVVPGANDRVGPEDIDRNEAKLKEADIVLLQLEIPVETALYAARKAKSLGKTVVLNPAPAQPLPEELFRCADFMTPNRTELSGYTGIAADGTTLGAAMRRLKELGAANVVTTLGAGGSAYLDESGEVRFVMGHPVPVIDTTGAGDCFNAALAVSIARGRSLREAVEYAGLASALAVTKFGAQAGMPTQEEVRMFAAERNAGG
ncbi:ribokinase [Paenibacillus macerans]|uniref:Ribokinase n=1 Tax=Paenibacillus macerans TaxID=44252 RepID=A0A6N8EZR7_PAEMA|nr:ribokinase [Paenibacillus macerans]MED4954165.1 ribokinase [Paenibacillus macerans]MUG25175.1 ribokinase [Paenibacillus macerans]